MEYINNKAIIISESCENNSVSNLKSPLQPLHEKEGKKDQQIGKPLDFDEKENRSANKIGNAFALLKNERAYKVEREKKKPKRVVNRKNDSDTLEGRMSASYISTKAELNKMQLTRNILKRIVDAPLFESTVMNCFVRIKIGLNNDQIAVYRVAEIIGVVEKAEAYDLEGVLTNRGFNLRHGLEEHVFTLAYVSNQDFSDSEFKKWQNECRSYNVPLPTIDFCKQKQRQIEIADNYIYTEKDINKIIENKKRFRTRSLPLNKAMEKTRLIEERKLAIQNGEHEKAGKIAAQLSKMTTQHEEEFANKRETTSCVKVYINQRNTKNDHNDAEITIMTEKLANKGEKLLDPFTRRPTQPQRCFVRFGRGVLQNDSPKKRDEASTSNSAPKKNYTQDPFTRHVTQPQPLMRFGRGVLKNGSPKKIDEASTSNSAPKKNYTQDPFTRRPTQPQRCFVRFGRGVLQNDTPKKRDEASTSNSAPKKKYTMEELHDFEIDIDIPPIDYTKTVFGIVSKQCSCKLCNPVSDN